MLPLNRGGDKCQACICGAVQYKLVESTLSYFN